MSAQTEMLGAFSFEKFLPAIPIVATGIALSFDVGYFYGIGLDYFTLFSLSEHIVFALEALPAALIFVLIVTLGDVTSEPISQLIVGKAGTTLDTKLSIEDKSIYLRRLTRIFFVVACVTNGSIIFFLWDYGWYRTLIVAGIRIFLLLVRFASDRWYASAPVRLLILGVCIAILMGEFFGSRYVVLPAKDILNEDNVALSVNVIRAGDRGVLYAMPDKHQIGFAQWNTIKGISRRTGESWFPDVRK